MTIKIPVDVWASVNATHERKMAELRTMMAAQSDAAPDSTRLIRSVTVNSADDVTSEVLLAAIEVFEMWHDDDERIDWDSFWDHLQAMFGFDVIMTDSSAARKIQRAVREHSKSGA